ncbi:MAG: hypothetical protein ACK4UT_01925, partial [Moraxellaceae bacterium]
MTETASPSPAQVRRNRWLLVLVLASFVVPFVVGDLAYKFGWYQGGQTNRGQLINPPLTFADLAARDDKAVAVDAAYADGKWWLVYVLPPVCEQACRNRLFQMRQVRLATGREADRVRQLVIATAPVPEDVEALLGAEFPDFRRLTADAATVDRVLAPATGAGGSAAGLLYLMDPMGWMMLSYPPEADEAASIIKGEDVLKDLR